MARSRDASHVAATDIGELVVQLNFILQRINDRIDKLEGIRESFDSQSGGNFEGVVTARSIVLHDETVTEIHSLGDSEA